MSYLNALKKLAVSFGNNYGLALGITAGVVAALVAVVTACGPEAH